VDLVVHQVVELEDVHVADRDRLRYGSPERPSNSCALPSPLTMRSPSRLVSVLESRPVSESSWRPSNTGVATGFPFGLLAAAAGSWSFQDRSPSVARSMFQPCAAIQPRCTSSTWRRSSAPARPSVEDDVDRRAVGQERHVLLGQDDRDDALVAVATGELVTAVILRRWAM